MGSVSDPNPRVEALLVRVVSCSILALGLSCAPPSSTLVATPAPAEVDGHGWYDTADPSPVLGRVHVSVAEERYTLTGATAEELAADLHARRPRDERFTGWTRWRLRWRFEPVEVGQRCRVGPVDVDLDLTTVLPAWDAPEDADPLLVVAWVDYLDALEHHEEGHAALAREAAERIRDRLTELPAARDCDALRSFAHTVGHAEVERLRAANAHLDDVTGHGATQGAVFPGPGRLAASR